MLRLSYDLAETLIFDPVVANRTATRTALYTLGFRHIETAATLEGFVECVRRRPPDLALCEAQGADAELCAMIQNLRLGSAGHNPFIVIIVTAWDNSKALVSRVLNSGADDLLLRPFSVAQLGQRIRTHIERRKGFVITSDYIGPDRRRDEDRDIPLEVFEPPNSLKMKARDRLGADETAKRLEDELRVAREVFSAEKLRRDAFQICILWRLLQAGRPEGQKFDADLARLRAAGEGVLQRCRESQELEPAVPSCVAVLDAVEGLEAGVDRNAAMHLLGDAALRLHAVFDPDMPAGTRLQQIDSTVAGIHARDTKDTVA